MHSLMEAIARVRNAMEEGETPDAVTVDEEVFGVTYGKEDGEPYFVLGYTLPQGSYAEIEDGTYGELQGVRVFMDREAL